jgi:hypothetical protein
MIDIESVRATFALKVVIFRDMQTRGQLLSPDVPDLSPSTRERRKGQTSVSQGEGICQREQSEDHKFVSTRSKGACMAGLALVGLVETARDRPRKSYFSWNAPIPGGHLRQICSVSTTIPVN